MQEGELIVTGTNGAQILLNGLPVRINVDYSDSGEILTTCNPQSSDTLEWEISGNLLTIRWKVSGIRVIIYKASFLWKDIK
jgi:hypothetical protein